MLEINTNQSFRKALIDRLGLDEYKEIVEYIHSDKPINDDSNEAKEFQKKYNAYFKIRRNEKWREEYFKFLAKNRNEKSLTFKKILEYLYDNCKTINGNNCLEPSFSSKMLAVINPEYPIWDSIVLSRLNKNFNNKSINNAVAIYDEIIDDYSKYLNSDEGKEQIRIFDELLPEYKDISNTKKLDTLIWVMG